MRASRSICSKDVNQGMSIGSRYQAILDQVEACCKEAGRDPRSVRIVAVSKTVGAEVIPHAERAGIHDFGENRFEGITEKQALFPESTWHFIGNVQSRKIAGIVSAADLIHSVYKVEHLPIIDAAAKKLNKVQDILLEVNVSGEASKGGLRPDMVSSFIEAALECSHVGLKGFMTMAPQGDRDHARACFESLSRIQHTMLEQFSGSIGTLDFHELSMGMSEDWPEAVAAGATIVRIGRAIFDEGYTV